MPHAHAACARSVYNEKVEVSLLRAHTLPFIPPLGAAGESAAFAPASARAHPRSSFAAITHVTHLTNTKKILPKSAQIGKRKEKILRERSGNVVQVYHHTLGAYYCGH